MAAVGGVAYMGAKAGSNRAAQQQSAGAQAPPQPAPPPAATPAAGAAEDASDRISQLKQLADLHSSGALTDEEFASEKAKVLA
jgi:hypothetical protein